MTTTLGGKAFENTKSHSRRKREMRFRTAVAGENRETGVCIVEKSVAPVKRFDQTLSLIIRPFDQTIVFRTTDKITAAST
jgi:hypothetical protein